MQKLLTKEKFISIFQKEVYRRKLDTILLNFFGLDTTQIIRRDEIVEDTITLEIIFMLNTEIILRIFVKDTKKLFCSSKKLYINLSYREVNRKFAMLIPGYFEIYIPYVYQHRNTLNKFYLFASLFACNTYRKLKNGLKKLEIFDCEEIEDILSIIKK